MVFCGLVAAIRGGHGVDLRSGAHTCAASRLQTQIPRGDHLARLRSTRHTKSVLDLLKTISQVQRVLAAETPAAKTTAARSLQIVEIEETYSELVHRSVWVSPLVAFNRSAFWCSSEQ